MNLQRWQRVAIAGAAVALLWALWWLAAIFVPVAIGLLVAYVLSPTVDAVARRLRSRGRAAGVVIGALVAAVAGIVAVAVPMVIHEGHHWAATVKGEGQPAFARTVEAAVDYGAWVDPDLETWQAPVLAKDAERRGAPAEVVRALRMAAPQASVEEVRLAVALGDADGDGRLEPGYARRWKVLARDKKSPIGQAIQWADRTGVARQIERAANKALSHDQIDKLIAEDTLSTAGDAGLRLLGSLRSALSSSLALLFAAVLVPIYAFFFSLALPRWREALPAYLPAASRDTWLRVLGRIGRAISGFVRGRVIVCTIVGVITAVGWMVLGVRLGLLAGLAVGALTLVPVANVAALIPTLALCLVDVATDQHGWGWFAGVVAVYAAGQIAESVLNPIIVGDAVQLDMVTMIVAFLVGAATAGLAGLILAVPVAATLRILGEEIVLPRWRAWANPPPPAEPPPGSPA